VAKPSTRWVAIAMNGVLSRGPYDKSTSRVREAAIKELPADEGAFVWLAPAFVVGALVLASFRDTGWPCRIIGARSGGIVGNLQVREVKDTTIEGQEGVAIPTEAFVSTDSQRELAKSGVAGVAYETIQLEDGSLPLLKPMSEVAGRMAVQVGATCLEKERGGKGVLLGGVPGTRRGRVVILGGGFVGRNAATIAVGMGAQVTVLDVRAETMSYLEDVFGGAIETLYSNAENIEGSVQRADLVIGAVLVPGAKAPQLVTAELISRMEKGSVVVDVAVDQGGCIATCRPTTHDHPTYEVHGVVHYCVANMPGAVSHTSTWALTNVTITYAIALADKGVVAAAKKASATSVT